MILLGIDNLSALEDLFGESLGDEIIEAVQANIAPALPERATLWRAEHRRLALSIPQLDRNGVSALVTDLQISIAQQAVPTSQGPVAVTVAAGCVVGADQPPDTEGSAARHALSEAMGGGVGCIRFAEESGAAARQREDIVAAAQIAMGALRDGDLVIAYQPVVSASGNNRAAFHECLVRVREKSGTLIAAAEFMPAMEQLGLATLIDRQVLVLALETLSRQPGIRISINIFPQTMQDAQWMILFDEGTSRDPTLAERLIIEVTETAAMLEPARTLDFMARLRRKGCAFALDDFGMGHTSFGSLRDFRFDIIKIDGSFITDITTNPDNRFFVTKLVEIGAHFDMMTVAEFVQGPADARILRDLGVEYFQGFYFGTPSLLLDPGLEPESVVLGAR
ncbi:MAG: EAL domain-containing protein [Proteobacteria bacterium]|nr:EAL domain-containing protein [Pseudomonadota bacterium]